MGWQKTHKEMIDYTASTSVDPIISLKLSKWLIKKEAKAVQNELLIHAAHPQDGFISINVK